MHKQYQVRIWINKYISYQSYKMRNSSDQVEKTTNIIQLLFKLCSFEIGAVFYELPDNYNSPENYTHWNYFANFGIVIAKTDRNSKRYQYYVTPWVQCWFEDMDFYIDNSESIKFLLIETDFKIYAYTNNELDIKIWKFLFEIEYVFPGFWVGHITRSSVRRVMKRGVGANSILDYLSKHAHNKMDCVCEIDGVKYNLPENVAHQIVIWEEEKNVITQNSVICWYEFADANQFDYYWTQIKTREIPILWFSKIKSTIIVPKSYGDAIKQIANREVIG